MISSSIENRTIRKFGATAFVFFGILLSLSFCLGKIAGIVLFGVSAVFGFLLLLFPVQLKPLYFAWIKTGRFISKIFALAALSIAYYVIMTPVAFALRIFGVRLIPMKPNRNLSSYWVTREEPAQPRGRFLKRY